MFQAPLKTPALITWCTGDELLYHPDTRACGPEECAQLFAPGHATLLQNSGPGHRPLPRDKGDAAALVNDMVQHIERWCPQ